MDGFWTWLASAFTTFEVPLTIFFTIVIAVLVRWILLLINRRVVRQIVSGVKRRTRTDVTQAIMSSPMVAYRIVQRTRTMASVLDNLVTWAIAGLAIIIILQALGASITAVVASVGFIGVALGIGAQATVKDLLNGLFMVFEDQLGVGDIVDLGVATGIVESVGVRVTTLRDVNGTLWFVRNGEIERVGNMSQGWARVIVDLAVPYETDVDAVEAKLLETMVAMASSAKWRSNIIEKPEVWGLETISAEALVIRLVMKTRTNAKDDVSRELRMRLKNALDEMGVRLPSLNTVVLAGFDDATRIRGARPPKTAAIPTMAEAAATAAAARPSKAPKAPRAPRAPRASKTPPTSSRPSASSTPQTSSRPSTQPKPPAPKAGS
jgi:small conductance mechanosensitive channel